MLLNVQSESFLSEPKLLSSRRLVFFLEFFVFDGFFLLCSSFPEDKGPELLTDRGHLEISVGGWFSSDLQVNLQV